MIQWRRVIKERPELEGRFGLGTTLGQERLTAAVLQRLDEIHAAGGMVRTEIVDRIAREYRLPNGRVGWEAAIEQHPEWKETLGWTGSAADYSRVAASLWQRSQVNISDLPPSMLLGMLAPVDGTWQVRQTAYTDGLPYCPHCGVNIAQWNRAYNHSKNCGRLEGREDTAND